MAEALYRRARERRIEAERGALRRMAEANPGRMRVSDSGGVELCDTPYYGLDGEPRAGLSVRFEFPEYYPSVPVEAFVTPPVKHPNVHPETGFACLWDRHHRGTSLAEAVRQVQRVVSCGLSNGEADHLMQPEAAGLPRLECFLLEAPREYHLEISAGAAPRAGRKRLS
jgi:hypothetical protein